MATPQFGPLAEYPAWDGVGTPVASTTANGTLTLSGIRVPPGVGVGQWMFLVVVARTTTVASDFTPPAGWTLVDGGWAPHATQGAQIGVYRKKATSGDAASTLAAPVTYGPVTVTDVDGRILAVILATTNVDDDTPVLASAFRGRTTSSLETSAALDTTGLGDSLIVFIPFNRTLYTYSDYTGVGTELVDSGASNTAFAVYADSAITPASSGITRSATASTQSLPGGSVILALKPSTANAAPQITGSNLTGIESGATTDASITATDEDGTIASITATSTTLTNITGTGTTRTVTVPPSATAKTHTLTWTATDNLGASTSFDQTIAALPATRLILGPNGVWLGTARYFIS